MSCSQGNSKVARINVKMTARDWPVRECDRRVAVSVLGHRMEADYAESWIKTGGFANSRLSDTAQAIANAVGEERVRAVKAVFGCIVGPLVEADVEIVSAVFKTAAAISHVDEIDEGDWEDASVPVMRGWGK
jgi:hypothetical protein